MSRRGATLELAILGLLADSPMHGYELRKQVNFQFGWTRLLSYGTLYPRLKQLTKAGFIVADESNERDKATTSRRTPIVYRLTAEGKEYFGSLLEDGGPSAWEDENFGIRFGLFSQTSSDTRVKILEGRRSRLEERLHNVRTASATRRARTDAYTRELRRHGLESVEREVRWLSQLIDQERLLAIDTNDDKDND